jgi:hypothetical protein
MENLLNDDDVEAFSGEQLAIKSRKRLSGLT